MASNRDRALQFQADLAKWDPLIRGRVGTVKRRVATVLAQNVIMGGPYGPGTPVDTGFARASWWISIGTTERSSSGPVMPPGKRTKDEFGDGSAAFATAMIMLAGVRAGGGTVYILNSAAYIVALEFGWSAQAPVGMVRIVLSAFQGIVDDVVRGIDR